MPPRPRVSRRAVPAFLLSIALLAGCGDGDVALPEEVEEILVAAAADLRPAFEVLGRRFEQETGVVVAFDFGSSGQLAQRIIEGAPVDLFASADAGFVDEVVAAGVGDDDTRATYASGRVVLWSRADRWAGWATLEELGADGEVTAIAIANPEHAPYGVAARQALERAGVLDAVEDRLVLGENVADTQRLVASGNADAGIVALSLAIAADLRGEGEWLLLDEELHDPLRQELVVTATGAARRDAAAFAAFVDGDGGREVMRLFGFVLPGEAPPG